MRLVFAVAAALLFVSAAHAQSPPASAAFDPSTPVESRIGGDIPATTLRSYTDTGRTPPTVYTPTEAEKRKVAAALSVLTPLQRSFAQKKLRSITFATGLQSNAQTTRSSFTGSDTDFDIVLNAIILKESVSDFLTRKENQLFDTSGSKLSVTVNGGSMDAVAYILLHEVTHMVVMSLPLTPQGYYRDAIPDDAQTPFTRGIWATTFQLAAPYHDPLFERVNFAPNAKTIPAAEAKSLYEALGKTPLVSIYASRGYPEDLPETVAWRQMEKLGQPYRIEVRDKGKVIYTYEPLKNPLLRARFAQLSMFDSPAAN